VALRLLGRVLLISNDEIVIGNGIGLAIYFVKALLTFL
jgi:hypothetical protein